MRGGKTIAAIVLLATAGLTATAQGQSYRTYAEIGQLLQDAATNYPSICTFHDVGLSYQGRHLWAVQISDNVGVEEDEPEFKYISTMHGDEWVGNEMVLYLVDYLLTNYGVDPQVTELVDEADIWLMPLMNPDGFDRASPIRYNAQGYDLNRSFPDPYVDPENTPVGRPTEVGVIMNWAFGESFTLSANLHGGSLLVNYPFDNNPAGQSVNTPTPDDDLMIYISEEYSRTNLPMWNGSWYHGISNGAAWYAIDGGMQDWNYHYMGNNEVTIELSNVKRPSASQIPTFWSDNRQSMLNYMATCLIGVRGLVTDGNTALPLAATMQVVGRDHDIYTDPDVGDYHRMLMPGTYDLRFTADGYDPVVVSNVVVSAGHATVQDVPLYPAPYVAYPNGGETLPAGVPAAVSWVGNPSAQFHLQYTDNFGDEASIFDGFEVEELGPEYTTGGDRDWYITVADHHSGSRSVRAGAISHSQTTWMERSASGGSLSFWHKVSSESGYDFFNFYIDGNQELHLSGNRNWTQYTTTLSAGEHVLRFEYVKDTNTSSYSDTVFIDDLELTADNTTWHNITALTPPGASTFDWTPPAAGDQYKIRVRSYLGGQYGDWDESDAVFEVTALSATGDYDNDGDVDMIDLAAFENCFGGSAAGACGTAFEFDTDGVITIDDYAVLSSIFVGP